jgi:hypothetical protein
MEVNLTVKFADPVKSVKKVDPKEITDGFLDKMFD